MSQIISALSEISSRYDALFVDLWGCVHNGVHALPEAVAALQAYRKTGGKVVLVTNSPRPRAGVTKQLVGFGVPDDAWDTIATSGDSARSAMFRGVVGQKVHLIGYPGDERFFEPIGVVKDPIDIQIVPLEEAEGIVCTGPRDPMADPDVMRPEFLMAKQMGLRLLCANPDIVVDRGEVREWCAGALAQLYSEMGGESLYFGKPHPPIYDLALTRLAALRDVQRDRILAIGDGPATDIAGAMGEGCDSVVVSGGLAAETTGTPPGGQPDPALLEAYLTEQKIAPRFSMGFMR